MNRFTLKIGLAAAAIAAAAPASATNGMRMIGFGPVQDSMGGASVAAPLDATTVVTNPAGLSALEQRFDLSGTAFMPSVDYDAAWTMDGVNMNSAGQGSDRPTDLIPTLAAVYRVQDKITLGFAALGTAGMGVSYEASQSEGLYMSRTYTNYINMRFAPGASYRLSDALSVGLAANVQYAMMSFEAGGMHPRDRVGALGLGATLGLTYKVAEQLTLAAAYESKSFFQNYEFDIPSHQVMTPTGPQTVPGGTDELDFDQPQVATIGVAARPIEGLLVAIDAQWINWSDTNGLDEPTFENDTNQTGGRPWNLDWSDQMVFKIGAQVDVPAVKGLKARVGYNYGANPLNEDRAFENIAFPAVSEHHFTVGAGYDAGKLSVNVAALYSPEATLKGSNPMEQGIVAYESRMSQLLFDVGVAYRY